MNFEKLKNLIKKNGDTFIFVEGGEPEMVLLSFHEYERLRNSEGHIAPQQSSVLPFEQVPTEEARGFLSEIDEDIYAAPYPENDSFLEPAADRTSPSEYEGFNPSQDSDRFDPRNQNAPLRREDVRLEDLPI